MLCSIKIVMLCYDGIMKITMASHRAKKEVYNHQPKFADGLGLCYDGCVNQ